MSAKPRSSARVLGSAAQSVYVAKYSHGRAHD